MTYDPDWVDRYIEDEPVDWYILCQRREKLLRKFIGEPPSTPPGDPVVFPSVRRYAPPRVEQKPPRVWLIPFVLIGVIFLCFGGMLAFYYLMT